MHNIDDDDDTAQLSCTRGDITTWANHYACFKWN